MWEKMTATRVPEEPPPPKNWFIGKITQTIKNFASPVEFSDSSAETAPDFEVSPDSDENLPSPGRKSKTAALKRITDSPSGSGPKLSRTSKTPPAQPRKVRATKLLKAGTVDFALRVPKPPTPPPPSETPSESHSDPRIAELEKEISSLRAQLLLKDVEHAQKLSQLTASITESVTKVLEEKFSSRFDNLAASIKSLDDVVTTPSNSRELSSYADITSSPIPKRAKADTDQIMTAAAPLKTRAQTIVESVTASQRNNCFHKTPAPRKGFRLVHIHGFNLGRGNPMKFFPAMLEVKYNFPRKYVYNVSPVNNKIAELVIDADSFEELQKALSVPGCKLLLATTLDVRTPISPVISPSDAEKFFLYRLDRQINRLRSLKFKHFNYIADFLNDYKLNDTRIWEKESRPTPIYMSAFLRPTVDPSLAAMDL